MTPTRQGTAQMPECQSCKTPHHLDDRYCGQCGTRLAADEFTESGAQTRKSLDLVDVLYNLGLVYYKQGQHQEALETWQKALESDSGNEALVARIAEVTRALENDR